MKLKPPRFQEPENRVGKPYASGHNFGRRSPRLYLEQIDAGPIQPNDTMNGERLQPVEVPPCLSVSQYLAIVEAPE